MMDCEDSAKATEMRSEDDNEEEEEEDEEAMKIKKKKFCKGLNNKTSVSATIGDRGTRPGRGKKGSTWNSPNSYEFYYYSGFGPSWGKRRADRINGGGRGGEAKIKSKSSKSKDVEGVITQNTQPPPSVSSEELDFMEEEDDYEEDDDEQRSGNGGKKRVRKLVKARSLKSLM